MRYLPHTDDDIREMLDDVGADSFDELFRSIPPDKKLSMPLDLPGPLSEIELNSHMDGLSAQTASQNTWQNFIGAGCYEHFIPAALTQVMSRSEFVTAYTPYQPELSQGTLQGIYEYQTLITSLLGMEVSNGSLYDGASAFAEGLLMAIRITKKKRVAVSKAVHPAYIETAKTYLGHAGHELIEIGYDEDGKTNLTEAAALGDLAAMAVQSPNFFGVIEDIDALAAAAESRSCLSLLTFSEAIAYGLLKSPGSCGIDIVCGEGRSLGLPMSCGGMSLGIFTAKKDYVRNMPGRIIGKTVDREDRPGYVITLATREQHIRRERATSNICTNQSLCALSAAVYMSLAGKQGLRDIARRNYDTAEYLKSQLLSIGFEPCFSGPTFNEFALLSPLDFRETEQRLLEKNIASGLDLGKYLGSGFGNCRLFCATETKTKADIDAFAEEVESCMK